MIVFSPSLSGGPAGAMPAPPVKAKHVQLLFLPGTDLPLCAARRCCASAQNLSAVASRVVGVCVRSRSVILPQLLKVSHAQRRSPAVLNLERVVANFEQQGCDQTNWRERSDWQATATSTKLDHMQQRVAAPRGLSLEALRKELYTENAPPPSRWKVRGTVAALIAS